MKKNGQPNKARGRPRKALVIVDGLGSSSASSSNSLVDDSASIASSSQTSGNSNEDESAEIVTALVTMAEDRLGSTMVDNGVCATNISANVVKGRIEPETRKACLVP